MPKKEPVHNFQWAIKQLEQKKWVARLGWIAAFSLGMNPEHNLAMFANTVNAVTNERYLRELPLLRLTIEDLTAMDWVEVPCRLRELNWRLEF